MPESQNRFSKEQKTGFILLFAFAILAVALGGLQIRNAMYRPFALNNSIPPMIGEDVKDESTLRFRDTDRDGLNDFDELYVYSTSPYIADTDSDGIPDGDEIAKGRNPLCDEAKNCGTVDITAEASSLPAKPDQQSLYGATAPQTLEEYVQDPAVVRQLLAESGLSADLIAKLSDDDLEKMAAEIFASSTLMNAPATSATETAKFLNEVMKK